MFHADIAAFGIEKYLGVASKILWPYVKVLFMRFTYLSYIPDGTPGSLRLYKSQAYVGVVSTYNELAIEVRPMHCLCHVVTHFRCDKQFVYRRNAALCLSLSCLLQQGLPINKVTSLQSTI